MNKTILRSQVRVMPGDVIECSDAETRTITEPVKIRDGTLNAGSFFAEGRYGKLEFTINGVSVIDKSFYAIKINGLDIIDDATPEETTPQTILRSQLDIKVGDVVRNAKHTYTIDAADYNTEYPIYSNNNTDDEEWTAQGRYIEDVIHPMDLIEVNGMKIVDEHEPAP